MTHIVSLKLIITLVLLTAVPLMTLNMFLPALGVMADDFQVGYDTMALAVSGYLVFTALLQVLAGPLADRYGRKPVLYLSLALFIAASIGCALAESFGTFLFFRIMQGAVVTGGALSRAIVSDVAPPKQTARLLGYIAMAMSLAPILGPSLGGFLADLFGWRSNFWVYTGAGFMLWALVWVQLPETRQGPGMGWAGFGRAYLALLANRRFWAYTLVMSFAVGGFFVFISGLPLVARSQLGLSQAQTGVGIGSIAIGFLIGSFISSRLVGRRDLDQMVLMGRAVATLGLGTALILLASGAVSPLVLFGGVISVGLGNGLTMPSASSAVLFTQRELAASASGLSGAVIVLAGAGLSDLTGRLLSAYPSTVVLAGLMLLQVLISLALALWAARLPAEAG